MFLPHKVIGRFKWHKEFESFENSKEQFPCAADAVGTLPKSPAFATLMQTGVLKLSHLWVSAGGIFFPASRALLLCHLCSKRHVPRNQCPRPHPGLPSTKQITGLPPPLGGITEAGVPHQLPGFPWQDEPQWSTVITCLITHHLLAAFPSCVTSSLPPTVFSSSAKQILAHGSLSQGMLSREPQIRQDVSQFVLLFYIDLKCNYSNHYSNHFAWQK